MDEYYNMVMSVFTKLVLSVIVYLLSEHIVLRIANEIFSIYSYLF